MEPRNGVEGAGDQLPGSQESNQEIQSETTEVAETRPDQVAYDKMTEAVRVIVNQFKLFPHLMDELAQEVEIALIKIAMDRCDGNCAKAARMLGINRTTLVEKRRRYKMELKRLDET